MIAIFGVVMCRGCLQILCVTTADRGMYSCRVFNLYHEVWSDQVHVKIGESVAPAMIVLSVISVLWSEFYDVFCMFPF